MEINEIDSAMKHSMKTRTITAIVMFFVITPCIVVGDLLYFAMVLFIVIVATYELLAATKKQYSVAVYIMSYFVVLCLLLWVFVKNLFRVDGAIQWGQWFYMGTGVLHEGQPPFYGLFLSTTAVASAAALLFFTVIIDRKFSIKDASFIFTFLVLLALAGQSMLFIRYFPLTLAGATAANPVAPGEEWMNPVNPHFYYWFLSGMLLVYVIIGTFLNDIGAYFAGVFFGKHKMNERISPKKTWEGFFGGLIISVAFSFTFAIVQAAVGYPILPIFSLQNWWKILIVSTIIPLASVLGDFAFSAIKREFGIKDFSNIFPGHGGVLDRFDSLLFSCLAATVLVGFFSTGWNFLL